MLRLIGVVRKSGTYEGNDYDNVMLHCINDNPSKPMICGDACEIIKVKARMVREVFGGLISTDHDWSELIGSSLDVFYDRYGNAQKVTILDGEGGD